MYPLNGGVPKDAKGVPSYKANKTHSNIICFTPHYIQEALQLLDFVLLSMLMVLDRHHQKANFLGLFHGARTCHKKKEIKVYIMVKLKYRKTNLYHKNRIESQHIDELKKNKSEL